VFVSYFIAKIFTGLNAEKAPYLKVLSPRELDVVPSGKITKGPMFEVSILSSYYWIVSSTLALAVADFRSIKIAYEPSKIILYNGKLTKNFAIQKEGAMPLTQNK